MKKLSLLVLLLAGFVTVGLSQRTITGTVVDENGEGLIGATVLVQGTTTGAATDFDGKFTLEVPEGATQLTISYTGFRNVTVEISATNTYYITLQEDVLRLEEAVVVGYGTQRRVDVSGAVSSVESKDIQNVAAASIEGALQGKVAGMNVTSNSGQPGAAISVRIRGNSSINAGNEPLYVIDGVPVTTSDFGERFTGGMDFNTISDLNPADIASVEILKDASASAIYGSRASNGVVLITTKRGLAQEAKITLNAYYGVQNTIEKLDMLTGEEFHMLRNEARGTNDPWNGLSTDFFDLIYQPDAPIQNYDFSVQGGDLKTKYYIGGSYYDQEGTIVGQRFQRLNGRLNLDFNATEKLLFRLSMSHGRNENHVVTSDNNIYGAVSLAVLQPSNVAAYNDDGTYNFTGMIFDNPIATALEKDLEIVTYRTLGNISARYEIIPGLKVQAKFGLDQVNFAERNYRGENTAEGRGARGEAGLATTNAVRWVNQNTVDYQKRFGNLTVGFLGGFDFEKYTSRNTSLAGTGFPSPQFRFLASAAEYSNASQAETENRLTAVYGRANFNWLDKYLVSVVVRSDGSSKFGANNKFGTFPSVSVAWRISNEPFMQTVGFIDDLKLRASYGETGNQQGIGNFAARGLAGGGSNYGGLPGVAPSQLANPDLQWEQTDEINIGLNLAVLQERIAFSFDYYQKVTKDLLLNRPLPYLTGFTSISQNVGEIENKGFEFSINTTNFQGPFTWTSSLQVSHNENTVKKLYDGQGFDVGFAGRIDEGEPLAYFYAWEAQEFVDPATGDMIYTDQNGDGAITAADRVRIGTPFPDFEGGFNNFFSFKGFDLNVFIQFVQGNDILNYTRVFSEDGVRRGFNNERDVLARWQNEGDVTRIPRISGGGGPNASRNNAASSRWLEDGSYIRMKSINLGYNFPQSLLANIGVSALRVYASADNIFTITDYTGLDPEVNFDGSSNTTIGTDFLTQGLNRTIKFGLTATF